ncbi:hypothetical protein [Bradyrhizobium sp. LTSPM299]|nr:hypothetical protein [Bradyrhizobium sp. LTSPM299]
MLLAASAASAQVANFVQRFQTLLAAFIAGIAAALAYEAALLKVEFDR